MVCSTLKGDKVMKILISLLMVLGLSACASGKIGKVHKALDTSSITKDTMIYVFPVTSRGTEFEGDKAADLDRVEEEKESINKEFHKMIAAELTKRGYKASVANDKVKSGVGVYGNVRKFDHGSAAARAMVGMGAGSSNLFTDFEIKNISSNEEMAKLEVIATSGGRGGLASMGSFLESHLIDGSEKLADYITGKK